MGNHRHSLPREAPERERPWRRRRTESFAPMCPIGTSRVLFYRRLIGEMAGFFGCDPTEDAALAARAETPGADLIRALIGGADIEAFLPAQVPHRPRKMTPQRRKGGGPPG